MNICPFEPEGVVVEAEVVGQAIDEEMGMPVTLLECPYGHTWQKPQHEWLVRSMQYANQALDVGDRRLQTG